MIRLKILCFILCITFFSFPLNGCLILVLTDGSTVLVGNHEDWFDPNAAVKINPPTVEKFGSVTFTFKSEGWAQGGMNSEGLFFDGALTPLDILIDEDTKPEFNGYLWQKILDECSTVRQAIDTAMKYRKMDLEEAHIVFADAKGEAAILGTYDGQVKVTYKSTENSYLLQTNFNPLMPDLAEEPFCWRYEETVKHLKTNKQATVDNVLEILEKTHQDELTVYSNIYDLTNRRIHVYSQRDFNRPIIIDLEEVLIGNVRMAGIEELMENPNILK